MNSKHTLSITEARKKIFDIAEKVQRPGAHFTLTENGRPKAVIMSAAEFESWAETLEVMKDFPDLAEDIVESEKDYKAGRYVALEQLLAHEGLVLADKGKKTYEVSRRRTRKGSKKSR